MRTFLEKDTLEHTEVFKFIEMENEEVSNEKVRAAIEDWGLDAEQ